MSRVVRLALAVLALASMTAQCCLAAGWSSMKLLPDANLVIVGVWGGTVRAFDIPSGEVKWTRKVDNPTGVLFEEHGRDVILIYQSGERVARLAEVGRDAVLHVEAVDPSTGEARWSTTVDGTLKGTPLVEGDRLYAALQRKAGPQLLAIDLKDGARAWEVGVEVAAMRLEGGTLYAVTPGGSDSHDRHALLQALDPATGTTRWSSARFEGEYRVGPDLVHGTVVFSTFTGVDEGRAIQFHGVSQADGRTTWTHDFPTRTWDEVTLSPPHLFGRTEEGRAIRVYDAQSGAARWTQRPAQASGPRGECASTTIHKDVLYTVAVGSSSCTVLAFEAASGRELAHLDVPGKADSPLWVVGDRVLLGAEITTLQASQIGRATAPEAAPSGEPEKVPHVLLCLEAPTLRPLWNAPLDAAVGGARISEQRVPTPMLVMQGDAGIKAFASDTGAVLWSFESDIASGPVFSDRFVAYGDGDLNFIVMDVTRPGAPVVRVNSRPWFNWERLPNLVFVVLIVTLILFFVARAREGRPLFIRRIAGLNALDEAVGRATEMGRPVLYVCGTQDVDEIQTLAGLSILGHVARRAAEYETPLLVPTSRSVVMSTAQEVVQEAHYKAGRPDSYVRDNVRYLTDDQFGYVAGVDGIMVRERPAANFYLGMFFGESLILAETGHATGAIQIAGTAEAAQLPFFVAACDYTLIGEELFAASAYLSKDPREVGSLKGQDYAKALIMAVILLGCAVYRWWPEVKTWLSTQ